VVESLVFSGYLLAPNVCNGTSKDEPESRFSLQYTVLSYLIKIYLVNNYSTKNKVPTVKEILFSRTFPQQNYHFLGQSIQDLKVLNQAINKKAYHIYSMYY